MSSLSIQLFGHIQITLPGTTAPAKLQLASQALLAYLLIQPPEHCSREQIIDSFWGEQGEESARSCMTTALWRLRRHLEADPTPRGTYLITTENGEIGFNWASNYWLDVEHFETTITPSLRKPLDRIQPHEVTQIEETLKLYKGELLLDLYEDWALRARERLRCLHLNSLEYLMRYYSHQQQYAQSLVYGEQILVKDPLREEIHQRMMQLYVNNGQRSLAIQQYKRCCQILAEELKIQPMLSTQILYQQIIDNQMPLPAKARPQPPPSRLQAVAQLQATLRQVDEACGQLAHAITVMQACLATQSPDNDQ